jgi:hypothetical protein
MNASAQAALVAVRESLRAGRYRMTPHFRQRLAERGILWVDILSVFDAPTTVRDGGDDDYGRPKWNIAGRAADGLPVEVVCALDRDERGRWTVLITVYFER